MATKRHNKRLNFCFRFFFLCIDWKNFTLINRHNKHIEQHWSSVPASVSCTTWTCWLAAAVAARVCVVSFFHLCRINRNLEKKCLWRNGKNMTWNFIKSTHMPIGISKLLILKMYHFVCARVCARVCVRVVSHVCVQS